MPIWFWDVLRVCQISQLEKQLSSWVFGIFCHYNFWLWSPQLPFGLCGLQWMVLRAMWTSFHLRKWQCEKENISLLTSSSFHSFSPCANYWFQEATIVSLTFSGCLNVFVVLEIDSSGSAIAAQYVNHYHHNFIVTNITPYPSIIHCLTPLWYFTFITISACIFSATTAIHSFISPTWNYIPLRVYFSFDSFLFLSSLRSTFFY